MPEHTETRLLPYTPDQMFALVSDVARYPEFVPWCIAARVRRQNEGEIEADLIIGYKMLRETFTSRVRLARPASIEIDYIKGPLRTLENQWRFSDDGKGGCRVDFRVAFDFRSRLFSSMMEQFFNRALVRMVSAFEARAEALYGKNG